MVTEVSRALRPVEVPEFVETPFIRDIVVRAMAYAEAGYPVHFRGAAGTGKTTLAFHLASLIGRPIVVIHGDEETVTSDLVGGVHGYRRRRVRDQFIHSVLKVEDEMTKSWVDYRLTTACKHGHTLIYDEYTRSRPEANNVLLSILEEKMLGLPSARGDGESYLEVHPDFTAIFTSNPEEYAGTFKGSDALRDRMVTLDLTHFDQESEVAIIQAKSGLNRADAEKIVNIIRGLRESGKCEVAPTVRGGIIIAKSLAVRGGAVRADDPVFVATCEDILTSETSRKGGEAEDVRAAIKGFIKRYC
ncbi:MAG: gas vesicle protein GvpN [Nitrospinota bacterium]